MLILALIPYYFFAYQSHKKHDIAPVSLNKPKPPQSHLKKDNISLSKNPDISANLLEHIEIPTLFDSPFTLKHQPLQTKISQLAKIWGKDIPNNSGCKGVETSGLQCLFDKTSWENLIALNRPAIMEFSISKSEKRYALLSGLKEGQPIFQLSDGSYFSFKEVLAHWNGYYLMLWKTPILDGKTLFPGESSRGVFWVRKQLSLIPNHALSTIYSASFDHEVKAEIKRFQKQKNLQADGIVGEKTFIHLQNINPDDLSPKLKFIK